MLHFNNNLKFTMITESELKEIELRCAKAQMGPWKAFIVP